MVELLQKYGFNVQISDERVNAHKRGQSSIDRNEERNEAMIEFKKYDSKGIGSIDYYQIRKYLEDKGINLTDEQTSDLLKTSMLNNNKMDLLEFQQFRLFIQDKMAQQQLSYNVCSFVSFLWEFLLVLLCLFFVFLF